MFYKNNTPWNKGIATIKSDSTRFWSRVNKLPGEDACWEWTGPPKRRYGTARNLKPYGLMKLSQPTRRMISTHRFSWELAYGPIPIGMQVCHHCDNPPCVRPDHLFLGTHKQNHEDCTRKKRRKPSSGEKNGMAKITEETVIAIRKMAHHMSILNISLELNLSQQIVRKAAFGLRWKHVPEPPIVQAITTRKFKNR